MKKAFTLIEMLIVVGIIAVLMSIVLVNVRGASDAANATKCMSNLRSLCNAANALAMDGGNYPLAGPCVRISYSGTGANANVAESTYEAWVSRDRAGNIVPCYGTGSEAEDRHAITNGSGGAFWRATAGNASIYNCPIFVKDHLVKRKCKPVFSYAMNAGQLWGSKKCGFASDMEVNYQSFADFGLITYGSYSRADKMVMFAELPIKQSCSYDPLANRDTCDATLKFNKTIGGVQYGNSAWKGRSEAIGFVHQDKRKKYFGHVAFTDGHVERYMQPPTSSSLKEDVLTAHICSGDDCAYDEKGYRFVAEAEDEEE